MIKNNKGSLTLEATIVLTLTICLVVTIIFFSKFVYVHTIVQHALMQTSKEISTYMYIAKMTGATDFNDGFNNDIGGAVDTADENLDNTVGKVFDTYGELINIYDSSNEIYEAIETLDSNALDTISTEIDNINTSVENAVESGYDAVQNSIDYLSDPRQMAKDAGAILLNFAYEEGKSLMLAKLSKAMMAKYLSTPEINAHENLLNASVIGGFEGLNFRGCQLLNNGGSKRKIEIVVAYDLELKLPFQFMNRVTIVQKAAAGAWIGD